MWAILQHAAWEGPGTIAEVMSARGIAHRIYRMDRGAVVPGAAELDGLIVMGGPMGVYEAEQYPHLKAEIELVGRMVAAGRPVLGVCLGAQLLAAALGATVERGPAMEIGAGEVELTQAGRADAVLGGDGGAMLPVVHWHQDTIDWRGPQRGYAARPASARGGSGPRVPQVAAAPALLEGAVRLASSAMYREQAFRFGERVYGLQFHLEVNHTLARGWRRHGLDLDDRHVGRVAGAGRRVWERFFNSRSA
jgi:GMP synthase (glutamine-hydrolysing)